MKKLVFLGGGSTGLTGAAYFALKGFETWVYDNNSFATRFDAIRAAGGLQFTGVMEDFVPLEHMTHDLETAVRGASIIFVNVIAPRHEEMARQIAPFLEDGQHIIISPGNLGVFVFRKVFDELGCKANVTLSGLSGNLFSCRIINETQILLGRGWKIRRLAAYPAADTPKVIQALDGVLEMDVGDNIFEVSMNFTNFIVHLPSTLLSLCAVDQRDDFNIYEEGMSPVVIDLAEQLDAERRAVLDALGIPPQPGPLKLMRDMLEYDKHEYIKYFHCLKGPERVQHRYLMEDSACTAAFLASVARRLNISTPVLDALLTISGAVTHVDYLSTGRTLENLGFAPELTMKDILSTL